MTRPSSHSRRFVAAFVALGLVATPAVAAPKKRAAKAQFDKGVAAYTKGDYAGASEALGKSFALEADVETLFAWAQTERKLEHCDKAIDLYNKLLATKLPEENKDAVRVQIEECNAILSVKPKTVPATDGKTEPKADAKVEPTASATAEPTAEPADPAPRADRLEPAAPKDEGARAWWKDPVGGALVGLGVVGVGVGVVFMVQGSAADGDKDSATTYADYQDASDRAESRGRIGVIGLTAGGALIAGGVIWYATHTHAPADKTVSGWLAPSGGGFAVSGRF